MDKIMKEVLEIRAKLEAMEETPRHLLDEAEAFKRDYMKDSIEMILEAFEANVKNSSPDFRPR